MRRSLPLVALVGLGCPSGPDVDEPVKVEDTKTEAKVEVPRSERLVKLADEAAYKSLKSFWGHLDAVEPRSETDGFYGAYGQVLAEDAAASLRQENEHVATQVDDLVTRGLLTPWERDTLMAMCSERLDFLAHGPTEMMTRMMPPPGMVERKQSLRQIELRIDVLMSLRDDGKLDDAQYTEALARVLDQVRLYAVFQALGTTGLFGFVVMPPLTEEQLRVNGHMWTVSTLDLDEMGDATVEAWALDALARLEAEAGPEAAHHAESRKALEEVAANLPGLLEIVTDLER